MPTPTTRTKEIETAWLQIPGTPCVEELVGGREGYITLSAGRFGTTRSTGHRVDEYEHGQSSFTIKLCRPDAILCGIPEVLFELDEINAKRVADWLGENSNTQLRELYTLLCLREKAEEIGGWGPAWGAKISLKL